MDKFKAYQQQMEKALRAFEYTTEWADLVNALGKVNKVLLNYSQFSKIPCDAILGRRLAQCLHPGLPNGVQMKALETYDHLFKAIGSDNLMQELSKFSNGLFPLLSHADLNVKPSLLKLYEDHFLPLNERLRPALDGFLIATLHGLEENSDFYQRTDDLLMKVCAGVGPEYFYGSLWRCILIDPSVRLHGMNFLIAHFHKKRPLENQLYILGNSREALIEAICVSLLDIRNVLVQRAALDLLLCCFPLHNQQLMRHDMIKLATGAVTVLMRRDTSLSRRLLAWIFNLDSSSGKKTSNLVVYGSNDSSEFQSGSSPSSIEPPKSREQREKERKISYFTQYAKPLLLEAFNNCLSDPSKIIDIPNGWSSLGDCWCYRLLICLIDHSELCELIIDDLCLDILRALCIDFRKEENQRTEFTRTIRLLLNSMNISYLWDRVYSLIVEVCEKRQKSPSNSSQIEEPEMKEDGFYVKSVGSSSTNILELCATYDFMMECFPLEHYVDLAKEFLPKILFNLLNLMIDYCDILKVNEYLSLTRVVANIFQGVNILHRDNELLKRAEIARNSLIQVPTPLRSNQISLVAEDEEYLVEEAVEPSNDSSNNATDEVGDRSSSEQNISHSNQPDIDDKARTPTLSLLIEKFQFLFHNFVTRRLLIELDIAKIYESFGQLLERNYLNQDDHEVVVPPVDVDLDMVVVYKSFCKVMALISAIPVVVEDMGEPAAESEVKPQSDANFSYLSCAHYVQDLMLLSYKVENIKINYASINLLLDMLSASQLSLDVDFALSNQLVESAAPTFSEEINASVVGDGSLLYERSQSDSSPTKTSRRLLLSNEEFSFIVKRTCWFPLAMKILWQYLSTEQMMWHDTVNLIQNMHNLTQQTLVCEDIICASLNSNDEQVAYDARRRFMLLFFLMKNDRSDLNLKHREFERPLFFMLDSLANKMDPFNCIAKDWLNQVYKFRATSRVLEPILKILLHVDTARSPITFSKINISNIHHAHMHLYYQVYDSQRILYALNTLWNVLSTDPHQSLIRMANSSIKGCHELHLLYARHCEALLGNNFHGDISVEGRQIPSFLELTIESCLNFLSSYYMQLPNVRVFDLQGNQKVRMLASEILRTIFSHLFDSVKGCPTHPIHDMLNRCKAQETILLLLATSISVQYPQQNFPPGSSDHLIGFNTTDNADDFQRTLLHLLEKLMVLEYRVAPSNVISETENHSRSARTRDIPDISSSSLKYFHNILISSQRIFLSAVKAALQNIHKSDLHINWLSMIESTISVSGRSLTRWIGCVISRLCDNLELISNCILNGHESDLTITPKYLSIIMSSLSYLTHYCLLDEMGHQSNYLSRRSESLSTLLPYNSGGSTTTLTTIGTSGPTSLMSNILHVFSNDQSSESGIGTQSSTTPNDPMTVARKEIFNKLSKIILALIQVWKAMSSDKNTLVILGAPADVKKQILTLLSPISLRHGTQFMNAVSFVWHELRRPASRKNVIPPCSPDQILLVEIVASISDLPIESVLQTTRQVIAKTQESRGVPLAVGLLQFFLAYIRLFPGSQLIECWKPLLHLLRDGLQLGRPAMPQAQFTLLALLHEFVQTAPLIEDRKDQKDLQEVAQKLIDSLTTVINARLQQTRWLRRALEVEPGPQHDDDEVADTYSTAARSLQPETSSISNGENFTDADSVTSASDDNSYLAQYTLQALNALAEYVAPVLDVVYASDEKEKVVNLICGIMGFVMPYLKNHHKYNSPSFLACSHLLSSISGYQYTRKAWRKEALELLLDAQFFHMDPQAMQHWRVIVDHLMTHDKTTFRDFLARMSLNQSTGVSKLFGSRDQESEQRAQLIKRMAFILFCSERDQYHKYTPEIQEKLIESLRDNPSDIVQSQIMSCFRVLIIRSSAHLLTSLWPFVYTEMVQGLLDIEAYLEQIIANAVSTNADRQQIYSNLQVNPGTAARFQLFLYTCKLLDMVLALPADSLPQFQMYRWSFIGARDDYEPHLVRIERRYSEINVCTTKLQYRNHYPILTLNKISNLLDLHPFFKTRCECEAEQIADAAVYDEPIKFMDAIIEKDFLE